MTDMKKILIRCISVEHFQTLHDNHRTWREFLCDNQFYMIALIWMLTRVISNISQVYLPLYIMDTTDASQVDRVNSIKERKKKRKTSFFFSFRN